MPVIMISPCFMNFYDKLYSYMFYIVLHFLRFLDDFIISRCFPLSEFTLATSQAPLDEADTRRGAAPVQSESQVMPPKAGGERTVGEAKVAAQVQQHFFSWEKNADGVFGRQNH